jgi:hypothetical protein
MTKIGIGPAKTTTMIAIIHHDMEALQAPLPFSPLSL